MRLIDMDTWSRRDHFNLFSAYGYPHFGLTVNVDLTSFYRAVKKGGHSFTVAMVYIVTRAANAVPEFRYRIQGEQVVEYEVVNPGFTFLTGPDIFSFCFADYCADFPSFAAVTAESIEEVKANPSLENRPENNVIYMTPLPWVSFTSFLHPMRLGEKEDSIPRFVWGRFFEQGNKLLMPLGAQAHHAVVDGIHMGKYFAEVQALLDKAKEVLS
jgi:chloramphenicol O-acetyltransferase type A